MHPEVVLLAQREDFESVLEVMTEDDGTGERHCYALGAGETQCRSCTPFEPEPCVFYEGFNQGWEENRLVGTEFSTASGDPLTPTPETDAILGCIEKNEHQLLRVWLIRAGGQWFVQAELNVNLWTPYEFYWYDPERGGLRLVHVFNGEYMIALRILDAGALQR